MEHFLVIYMHTVSATITAVKNYTWYHVPAPCPSCWKLSPTFAWLLFRAHLSHRNMWPLRTLTGPGDMHTIDFYTSCSSAIIPGKKYEHIQLVGYNGQRSRTGYTVALVLNIWTGERNETNASSSRARRRRGRRGFVRSHECKPCSHTSFVRILVERAINFVLLCQNATGAESSHEACFAVDGFFASARSLS